MGFSDPSLWQGLPFIASLFCAFLLCSFACFLLFFFFFTVHFVLSVWLLDHFNQTQLCLQNAFSLHKGFFLFLSIILDVLSYERLSSESSSKTQKCENVDVFLREVYKARGFTALNHQQSSQGLFLFIRSKFIGLTVWQNNMVLICTVLIVSLLLHPKDIPVLIFTYFLVCRGHRNPWPGAQVQGAEATGGAAQQHQQQGAPRCCHWGHLEMFHQHRKCADVSLTPLITLPLSCTYLFKSNLWEKLNFFII